MLRTALENVWLVDRAAPEPEGHGLILGAVHPSQWFCVLSELSVCSYD